MLRFNYYVDCKKSKTIIHLYIHRYNFNKNMKTSVRIVQINAKTLKILFVCLCIIVIFVVSFEASLVARLNKTWCVLQSDVASLNEKTSDVFRAAKTTLLQQKDKSDHDNTSPLQPCTGSKLGNYNCTLRRTGRA